MTDQPPATAPPKQPDQQRRLGLLGAIDTPLKFYVLALLIVETFLGATLVGARLDAELQKICIWLGVGMFALVVGIVSFLLLVGEELTRKR
ncbi:MAG TPA: hypothetical protein VK581_00990 [Chthoniobacterales bacterium]|nr:hypothetical protein [Chthoniobacterales bacterium]